ncbi:MAG TPA: amino acid adenylation domain-containing protein, partial [Puia sp.]|nr:amino acid adenylation domain-containing protein [Puia sp.]
MIKDVDERQMGFRVAGVELYIQTSYDLSVVVNIREEGRIKFYYNANAIESRRIRRMAAHFDRVLKQVSAAPEMAITRIEILLPEERQQLLNWSVGPEITYPRSATVTGLFAHSARLFPDRPALRYKGSEMTYKELHERSNQLAHFLRDRGVRQGTVVGLMMERSMELIIGLLGILKAGGAYMPMEPGTPEKRMRHMLEESRALLLLTGMDDDELYSYPTGEVKVNVSPESNAYILYTSGSTGKPKGVMIPHSALTNYICWASSEYAAGERVLFALFSSIAFDLTVTSIFCPLVTGNTLEIYEEGNSAWLIETIIEEDKASVIKLTPSHLKIILGSRMVRHAPKKNLRRFIVGGEELTTALAKDIYDLFGGRVELINEYGPTEATVGCMIHRFRPDEAMAAVPIGVPAANVRIYVLDRHQTLAPAGTIGEMYISGAGIARGYVNNEELTKERFLDDPFAPGMRMYRTGDLARWLDDSKLEFLGRTDEQVKIKGFRIELGEITNCLRLHRQVKDAIVLTWEAEGSQNLVAYYVSEGEIQTDGLRLFLSARLPDYMLPAFFVRVERMPLTTNGKLDKKALPAPQRTPIIAEEVSTAEERLLVSIWEKVLGREGIGVTENFLSLGGDSIKSLQLVSRLYTAGYEITVKEIFLHPTIRQLAVKLRKIGMASDQSVVREESGLTPVQQLFFEGVIGNKDHYNQSVLLHFGSGISGDEVRRIGEKLQEHHDALRMVFVREGDKVVMRNRGLETEVRVQEADLTGSKDADMELLRRCNSVQGSIDLAAGPLMKLGLFHMEGGSRLLIVIHHLVVDGVSWRILLEDIDTLYRQLKAGAPLSLPQKTASFVSWPSQLSEYRKSAAFSRGRVYWSGELGRKEAMVPRDYPEGKNIAEESRVERMQLDSLSTELLLTKANDSFGTRVNDLLLCAFLLSIRRQYGMNGIRVDLEGHGREEVGQGMDVSRTVGWYTSLYPVVLESASEQLPRLIKEVKETLRRVPNNGIDYLLLNYGDKQAPVMETGRSRIVFNYLGQFDTDIRNRAYSIAAESSGEEIDPGSENEYDWQLSGLVKGGVLEISLRFSNSQYKPEAIRSLMDHYRDALASIISFCCRYGKTELTPSDLTYKRLPVEE